MKQLPDTSARPPLTPIASIYSFLVVRKATPKRNRPQELNEYTLPASLHFIRLYQSIPGRSCLLALTPEPRGLPCFVTSQPYRLLAYSLPYLVATTMYSKNYHCSLSRDGTAKYQSFDTVLSYYFLLKLLTSFKLRF